MKISKKIGGTLVVSNQIGYVAYEEYKNGFSGDRFVDLEDMSAFLGKIR